MFTRYLSQLEIFHLVSCLSAMRFLFRSFFVFLFPLIRLGCGVFSNGTYWSLRSTTVTFICLKRGLYIYAFITVESTFVDLVEVPANIFILHVALRKDYQTEGPRKYDIVFAIQQTPKFMRRRRLVTAVEKPMPACLSPLYVLNLVYRSVFIPW